MRLRLLGNTGRYLAPLTGGSGYLVESAGGARVLLDAGAGVRAALVRAGVTRVDAVVLSHFHHDHVLDFLSLYDAYEWGAPVFLPPGETRRFEALGALYAFEEPFVLKGATEVAWRETYRVRDLDLRFAPTQHSAPSVGTRVTGADGATLVYASDGAPCDALRDLARDADVLLMHALLPDVEPDSNHARIHATARTAGEQARDANARRLLLSHRFHESRDDEMMREAARAFGATELARDDATYDVARHA